MRKFTNENGAEVFVMGPEEVAEFVTEVTLNFPGCPPVKGVGPPIVEKPALFRVTWNYRGGESMTASHPFTWAEVEHELLADEGPDRRTTWELWS